MTETKRGLFTGMVSGPIPVLYWILAAARIVPALLGLGYIHPDEYFQNGEVTAGSILGVKSVRTWEWDPNFPVRSILPPLITTGIPFLALRTFTKIPPRLIFTTERLSSLLSSFILDYCVYRLSLRGRGPALLLLASSSTMLTFQLRPFSNSLEAVMLSICLVLFFRYQYGRKATELGVLGARICAGIFTRLTFVAFAAPFILRALWTAVKQVRVSRRVSYVLVPAVTTLSTVFTFIALDAWYFHGSLHNLPVTPYNFLVYNLSPDNLAQHGLHPRWLHAVVNFPMIVGPLLAICSLKGLREVFSQPSADKKIRTTDMISRVCAEVIVSGLALLSVQPHQEPRFLVPLLVPTILLLANTGTLEKAGRWFWIPTIASNIILTVVFGVLHQGGVVPAIFEVQRMVSAPFGPSPSAVVFWKTYMPPQHLLAIPKNVSRPYVVDLAGSSNREVDNLLRSVASQEGDMMYVVAPPSAVADYDSPFNACLVTEKQVWPHLDLDHIGESVAVGLKDGLSLGIYSAQMTCLQSKAS